MDMPTPPVDLCGFKDTKDGTPCTHRMGAVRCAAGHPRRRRVLIEDPSGEPTAEIPVVAPTVDAEDLAAPVTTELPVVSNSNMRSTSSRGAKQAQLRTGFRGRLTTTGGDLTAEELLAYESSKGSLEKANLSDVCLMGEDLTGLSFPKVKLYRANLTGCHGDDVSFVGARLWSTQCYGAEFVGIPGVTGRPNFHRAEFLEADLTRAKIHNANCTWACFRGANLTNASFQGSDLSNSDFTGATLTGCDFSGAKLDAAVFDAGCAPSGFGAVVRSRKPAKSTGPALGA